MLHKLSAATVTRIKAQQVITGLVAAVKELLEYDTNRNALDAGATQIQIKLEGDGLAMIQVKDNGTGIPVEATDECAVGYCTSKIIDFESLSQLTSYGFREGEVEVTTRTASDADERTTCYNSDGGIRADTNAPAVKQTVLLGKTGTSVTVKNIFARTPVRLERMKKDRVKECKNILNLMYAYMLAHPRTSFSLSIKGHIEVSKLRTKKGVHNNTYEVIQELYGPMLASGLVQIETVNEDKSIKITGLLPKTDAEYKIVTRATNDRMFIYVNNRPVDFPAVTKIVNLFVRKWFAVVKRYPFAVLNIELKPDTYDVNVTPDKKKLFFHNENNLVQFIHNVLKSLYPVNDLDTVFAINPAAVADNDDEKDKEEDKNNDKTDTNDDPNNHTTSSNNNNNNNNNDDDDDPTQSSLPAEYRRAAPLISPSPPSSSSPPPTTAAPSTPDTAPTAATASTYAIPSSPPSSISSTNATPCTSSKPTSSPPSSSKPTVSSLPTSKSTTSSTIPTTTTTTSSTQGEKRKADTTQSSATSSQANKKQKPSQNIYDIIAFMLCYEDLLKEMVVLRQNMDPPVMMTQDLFEGDEDMWRVARAKSPTIVRAFHANGFELHPHFDATTLEYLDVSGLMIDQDTVELRAIPKDIEGIGADDLVELVRALAKVYDQDSLSIPPSAPPVRPERIASFLMNEANRITRSEMGESELTTKEAQALLDKLVHRHKATHTTSQQGADSNLICCECPHGKPIFQFMTAIPNVE